MSSLVIKKGLYHLFGIGVLLFAGLFNQYPLVTPDTGTYLNCAFDFSVPQDRTFFYSLFVLFFSLKLSLWLVIIAQSVLLYACILTFLSRFFPQFTEMHKSFIVIFTGLLTSVSWFGSQLMPDIFTSIVLLSSLLFLYAASIKQSITFGFILFFGIISHNSHLIISILFFTLMFIFTFFNREIKILRSKTIGLMIVSILGWFAVMLSNLYGGHGFTASKTSHVFLVAKLSENGILKEYLEDNCYKTNYKLCPYKNNLPIHGWDFIWENNGAFANSGAWNESREEYVSILKGTLTRFKYIKMHIIESFKATRIQFSLSYVGDGLNAHVNGENPSNQIQKFFPKEISSYTTSKQNTNSLSFNSLNKIYHYFFLVLFFIVPILYLKKGHSELKIVYLAVFLFVLLNAFVTASFANILGRLNSRALWLLVFMHISLFTLFLIEYLRKRKA